MAVDFFETLFTQEAANVDMNLVFQGVPTPSLLVANHNLMSAPFTPNDIWMTFKSMHPTKAPGLDGFHAKFY